MSYGVSAHLMMGSRLRASLYEKDMSKVEKEIRTVCVFSAFARRVLRLA